MSSKPSYLSPWSSKPVRILVVGRVSTGKSALVNKILNDPLAAEGLDTAGESSLTTKVQCYSFKLGGVPISVYDSPGLRGGDVPPTVTATVEEIFKQCGGTEVDLMIYCYRLDHSISSMNLDREFEIFDQLLMKNASVWNNTVFALTFSNNVDASRGPITQLSFSLGDMLCTCLTVAGLDPTVASNIPLVPVAYRKEDVLPGQDNWYEIFWNVCVNRMRENSMTMELKIRLTTPMSPDTPSQSSSLWEDWLLQSRESASILVTGKTGAGKSSLINGMVGLEVAKEGSTLERCTTTVQQYKVSCQGGVVITIWDSPGLQDGLNKEKKYILDMQRKGCANTDLAFYCTKMNETRLSQDDKEAIKKLTKGLGTSFWNNSVFVLTFANDTRPPPSHEFQSLSETEKAQEVLKFFNKRLKEWEEKLREAVVDAGVKPDVAAEIPVVATGYETDQTLPDADNWLSKLWLISLERMKSESQAAFLVANKDRIKSPDQTKPDDFKKPLHEQPIVIKSVVKYSAAPVVISVLAAVVGAAFGGPVGAAAGAVAGASAGGVIDGIIAAFSSRSKNT